MSCSKYTLDVENKAKKEKVVLKSKNRTHLVYMSYGFCNHIIKFNFHRFEDDREEMVALGVVDVMVGFDM